MTDGSEKRNRLLASDLQNSHVCQKRSNDTLKQENLGRFPFTKKTRKFRW